MRQAHLRVFGVGGRPGAGVLLAASLLLAAAAPLSTTVAGQDQDQRQRMYYQVKPAIVFVQTLAQAQIQIDLGNQRITGEETIGGGGSGWIITPDGYLVTNGHVVELYHADNEEQIKLELLFKFLGENFLPQVARAQGRDLTQEELAQIIPQLVQRAEVGLVRQLHVVLQNGEAYPAEVKQYSPSHSPFAGRVSFPGVSLPSGKDVAILKIEARNLPTVAIGSSDALSLGDDIHVGGYPAVVMSHMVLGERTRLDPSFTRGGVSGARASVAGADLFQIDAAVTWGNSGGPVFNSRGEVVGMATLGSIHQSAQGVRQAIQGFNFAVPTSSIMEFVRAEGISPSSGLFTQLWTSALDAYYAQQWTGAVEAFDEVLRIQPNLPDAMALRANAMGRRGTEPVLPPPSADTPWLIFGLVALGLGLVGAGIYFRRRTEPAVVGAAYGGGAVEVGSGGGRRALPAGMPILVMKEGPLQGNRFPVPASGIKIGRDPSTCQVVVNEAAVSREHAVVAPGPGGQLTVRNLSGTNPTYVNGRPVQETTLSPGDRIKIAGSVMAFEKE
jgi:S1-C subfamily serine protease